jgi:hypothetical protein
MRGEEIEGLGEKGGGRGEGEGGKGGCYVMSKNI